MKRIKYFIIICILFLISCDSNYSDRSISQDDIDYVESFKKRDAKEHLVSIDSLLNTTNQNEARQSLIYIKKGILHSIAKEDEKAIENYQIALNFFEEIDDKKHIAKTYYLLGSANAFLDKKAIANKQLLTALQYSKDIDDKKIQADVYGSLGHIHYLYKDFGRAIGYAEETIDTYKEMKDTLGLSVAYNNIAIMYKNTGRFEEAIIYNTKSLDLSIIKKDTIAIINSHNNIGNLINEFNDKENAIKHFEKAIQLIERKEILLSSAYENLGDLYLKNKEFKQSKFNYLQALEIESKKTNVGKKLNLNNALLNISLQEKDFENAVFYQRERDSLNNLQIIREAQEKLGLVESQYQLAASQQDLKQEQRINKKNSIIFLIVLGVLSLLGLSWLLYSKNKKLKIEKEKMYLEQKVLRSQMNPHFIFNVLSSIQNSLMDNDPIKSATYLSRFAKLFRQNFDFIDRKTITLRDEIEVLGNYVDAQKLRYKDKFDYQLIIDDNIDIDVIEIPPLLLQPFLENAIEHGFKNKKEQGQINLSISKKGNTIWYEIKDNGKGYDASIKPSGLHALDIFKKRLKLLENGDEKSLIINSSDEGTSIKFGLKND